MPGILTERKYLMGPLFKCALLHRGKGIENMRNRHSVHNQIRYLQHRAKAIGQSKHKAKDRNGKIFSIKTLEKYGEIWHRFAEYAKEQSQCRNVADFQPAHVYLYVSDLITAGKSPWTIKLHVSALQKLNQIAQMEFHTRDFIQDVLTYIRLPQRRLELRRPNRLGAYTQEQIMAIAEALEEDWGHRYKWAVIFQWLTGARMESIVDDRNKGVTKSRLKGTGVTLIEKGGKMRMVVISPAHYELWGEFRAWALQEEHGHKLFALDRSRYSKAVATVAREVCGVSFGTHGTRKAFAVARHKEYLAQSFEVNEKKRDEEARARVALDLGHGTKKTKGENRIAVTYAYIQRH